MARAQDPHPPAERTWLRLALVVVVVSVVFVFAARWDPRDGTSRDIDLRNGRAFIHDNLWSEGDEQFAVWVDDQSRPVVGVRSSGEDWTTVDLASLPDNPLAAPTDDNRHNIHVIAVDQQGHVHIAGNMRADPLRYIRTAVPGRLDRWVEPPVGGRNQSVTYPAFVSLPDHTLLFLRREGNTQGGRVLLDRLDPGGDQWEHLGAIIDGVSTGERPYLHQVAVDPHSGAVHVGWVWRGGRGPSTNRDVSYMRSDDGGRSWASSTGAALAVPVTHDNAEIVFAGSGILNNGGMVVDSDGRPHIAVSGGDRLIHVWFDGSSWHQDRPVAAFKGARAGMARGPDGTVWAVGIRGVRVSAEQLFPEAGPTVQGTAVATNWEPTFDTQAMQRDDRVDLLIVPRGEQPFVETLVLG